MHTPSTTSCMICDLYTAGQPRIIFTCFVLVYEQVFLVVTFEMGTDPEAPEE